VSKRYEINLLINFKSVFKKKWHFKKFYSLQLFLYLYSIGATHFKMNVSISIFFDTHRFTAVLLQKYLHGQGEKLKTTEKKRVNMFINVYPHRLQQEKSKQKDKFPFL
jgi:hypothetical protein